MYPPINAATGQPYMCAMRKRSFENSVMNSDPGLFGTVHGIDEWNSRDSFRISRGNRGLTEHKHHVTARHLC
jgi:hypothetical protein